MFKNNPNSLNKLAIKLNIQIIFRKLNIIYQLYSINFEKKVKISFIVYKN